MGHSERTWRSPDRFNLFGMLGASQRSQPVIFVKLENATWPFDTADHNLHTFKASGRFGTLTTMVNTYITIVTMFARNVREAFQR